MSIDDAIHPVALRLAAAFVRTDPAGRALMFAQLAIWAAPRLPSSPDPTSLLEQYGQADCRARMLLYAQLLELLNAACVTFERDHEACGLPPLAQKLLSRKPRPT